MTRCRRYPLQPMVGWFLPESPLSFRRLMPTAPNSISCCSGHTSRNFNRAHACWLVGRFCGRTGTVGAGNRWGHAAILHPLSAAPAGMVAHFPLRERRARGGCCSSPCPTSPGGSQPARSAVCPTIPLVSTCLRPQAHVPCPSSNLAARPTRAGAGEVARSPWRAPDVHVSGRRQAVPLRRLGWKGEVWWWR